VKRKRKREFFLAEGILKIRHENILTSFVGDLLGTLEGDRFGLVVGCEC